jgi:hypothetical protein
MSEFAPEWYRVEERGRSRKTGRQQITWQAREEEVMMEEVASEKKRHGEGDETCRTRRDHTKQQKVRQRRDEGRQCNARR